MSSRLRVVHSTGYTYEGPATSSFNEARLTPRNDSRQTVVLEHVDIVPSARIYRYSDYWGTIVSAFDLHTAHDRLQVVGTTVIETEPEQPAENARSATWEDLRSDAVLDEFDEMLTPTAYVPSRKRLSRVAEKAAKELGPAEAVDAVVARVHEAMTYETGTTEVTPMRATRGVVVPGCARTSRT